MQELHSETRDVLYSMAYAENTLRNTRNQLAIYERFCTESGFHLWSAESAAQWLLYAREVTGLKENTIQAKYDAYKWGRAHVAGQPVDDKSPGQPLYLLKRVIARLADDRVPKRAVGKEILRTAHAFLRGAVPEEADELEAWFLLSYALLLRASEAQSVHWPDVQWEHTAGHSRPCAMTVTLRASDGRVFKTHSHSVQFRCEAGPDKRVCAVRALWRWFKAQGCPDGGRVFVTSEGEARLALQVMAAAATREDPACFGLHSLRAGGATDLEAEGASLSYIMSRGRWRSCAVLLYLRGGESMAQILRASS